MAELPRNTHDTEDESTLLIFSLGIAIIVDAEPMVQYEIEGDNLMKTHIKYLVVSLLSTLILMTVLCFQSGMASAQDKDNSAKSIIPVISTLLLSDRLEIVTGSTPTTTHATYPFPSVTSFSDARDKSGDSAPEPTVPGLWPYRCQTHARAILP